VGQGLEHGRPAQPAGDAAPKTTDRYRTSPSERQLLDLSGATGIPRSDLLGRQRKAVTRYHYDEAGRLEWSETTYSPNVLDEDLDALLEWQFNQSLICSGCGHYLDETTDPDTHPSAFITEKVTCMACASKERQGRHDTKGSNRLAPGVKYRVRNRAKD
jgi:hypothetical protein